MLLYFDQAVKIWDKYSLISVKISGNGDIKPCYLLTFSVGGRRTTCKKFIPTEKFKELRLTGCRLWKSHASACPPELGNIIRLFHIWKIKSGDKDGQLVNSDGIVPQVSASKIPRQISDEAIDECLNDDSRLFLCSGRSMCMCIWRVFWFSMRLLVNGQKVRGSIYLFAFEIVKLHCNCAFRHSIFALDHFSGNWGPLLLYLHRLHALQGFLDGLGRVVAAGKFLIWPEVGGRRGTFAIYNRCLSLYKMSLMRLLEW